MITRILLIAILLFGIPSISAGQSFLTMGGKLDFHFNVEYGKLFLDKGFADEYAITSDGWSMLRFGSGARFAKFLFIDMGFGFLNFADRDEFTETVTGGSQDLQFEAYSQIFSSEYFAEFGMSYPLFKYATLDGAVGMNYVRAYRGIPDCNNCTEQNIPINLGLYVMARAYINKERQGAYIGSRFYLFSDMNFLMSFGFMFD